MSGRLTKNGSPLTLVGDDTIVSICITKSGQIQLEAPTVSPAALCKMLHNLIVDITYSSFQQAEVPKIQPLM